MSYEITFITKDEKDPAVKKTIESLAGKIIKNLPPERKKFSYVIKKESAGFYTSYLFESKSENIGELDKKLKMEEEILRYLITQKITRLVKEKPAKRKKTIAIEKVEMPQKVKATKIQEKVAEKLQKVEKTIIEEKKEAKKTEVERITAVKPKVSKPTEKPMPRPQVGTGPAPKAPREVEITEEERLKALEDKLSELLKE